MDSEFWIGYGLPAFGVTCLVVAWISARRFGQRFAGLNTAAPQPAAAPTRSPFDSTPVLVAFAAAALVGFYDWRSLPEIVTMLRLPDTDDAMRLVDVRALVAGQGWFDTVQHRLGPPDGVPTHWSRLIDAPLAALILALAPMLGQPLAEGVTVVVWPVLTLVVYVGLLLASARRAFGRRAAWLALFCAGQGVTLGGVFALGRIDHHNVQACAVFGLAACLGLPGVGGRRAALAGMLAAFSLAVGLETLPFVATAGFFLAALWLRDGEAAAGSLSGYGLGLALTAPLLFAAQTDPDAWNIAACDALSPPWLWIAGGAGLAGLLPHLRLTTARARLLALGALGAGVAAGFAFLFPQCLAGPFGDLPPLVRLGWLRKVYEARSFWSHLRTDPAFALVSGMPVFLATLAAGWLAWRVTGQPQARFLALTSAMLATGSLIAQVQLRGVYIAAPFVPLVAGLVLDQALVAPRDEGVGGRRRVARFLVALALLGQVWALAATLPTLFAVKPAPEVAGDCNTPRDVAALDVLPPGLVLAPIDLGPMILLRTHHAVVAAPYHRGVAGLMASLETFNGDAEAGRAALAASGATYLVACPGRADDPPSLRAAYTARLVRGEVTASWLAPVPVPGTVLKVWRAALPPRN